MIIESGPGERQSLILSLLFVFFIGTGFFTSIFNFNPNWGAIVENRALAVPPVLQISDPEKLISEFDVYFNDHFGLRSALIRCYALFRYFVLHTDSAENRILEALGVEEF